jgi:pimeloyl-ACP methyl ester carboxylesterase
LALSSSGSSGILREKCEVSKVSNVTSTPAQGGVSQQDMLKKQENNKKRSSQFSFKYKTEVVAGNNHGFELSGAHEKLAQACYSSLNSSMMFNVDFIKDAQAVRDWHCKRLGGVCFDVQTPDDFPLPCTFFDRGKDTLVVIGEGFTNNRELMSPFIDLMSNYDVLLFDFRGHGYEPFSITDIGTWPMSLSKAGFGADAADTTFGHKEEIDVYSVVDYCKKKKNYKRVFGIGLCYGAFIFLKAASLRGNIFDKIILDGCWLSLRRVIDKLKQDLKMLCVPQTGGWKDYWISKQGWFQRACEWLAINGMGSDLTDVSLLDYAPKCTKTPVLFMQGKDDMMVTRDEFLIMWQALATPEKIALITSNPHVRNHWKQKELYALITELFFEYSFDECVACLSDVNKAYDYFVRLQQKRLNSWRPQ